MVGDGEGSGNNSGTKVRSARDDSVTSKRKEPSDVSPGRKGVSGDDNRLGRGRVGVCMGGGAGWPRGREKRGEEGDKKWCWKTMNMTASCGVRGNHNWKRSEDVLYEGIMRGGR